jgi:plastocyanin
MSRRQKRSLGAAVTLLVVMALGWVLVAGARLEAEQIGREIVLEARGMAFYLPGDPTANPTLRFAAGERVRLTLVNRDPGMEHDLALAGLGVATPVLGGEGARHSLVLRLPATRGEHDYVCTLHPLLMRGRLVVG